MAGLGGRETLGKWHGFGNIDVSFLGAAQGSVWNISFRSRIEPDEMCHWRTCVDEEDETVSVVETCLSDSFVLPRVPDLMNEVMRG